MIRNPFFELPWSKDSQVLLIFLTVFSWSLFPVMLKQFNVTLFQAGFAICLLVICLFVALTAQRNQVMLTPLHKLMLICGAGYLCMLLIASVHATSRTSIVQWCILFTKFLFFLFLLFHINRKFVYASMRIYANLMGATVVFSLAAIAAVLLSIHPFSTMEVGGRAADVFFGAYYITNTPICPPTPVFRIQGLSEEPGTYAFALMPALFWFLIAEKAYLRSTVIVLGLMLSMSLGAGLFLCMVLVLILLLMVIKRSVGNHKLVIFLAGAIGAIALMYGLAGACTKQYLENLSDKSAMTLVEGCMKEHSSDRETCVRRTAHAMSTTPTGKSLSLHDRKEGLRIVIDYLKAHPVGTGAALGMQTVQNSIAVGYAVATLESGIVGGVFYIGLFAAMGWLALRTIAKADNKSFDGRVNVVVSLSIGAVLVMGAQRIQPDLSFWHMWLYAIWFHLLQSTVSGVSTDSRTL